MNLQVYIAFQFILGKKRYLFLIYSSIVLAFKSYPFFRQSKYFDGPWQIM